MSASISAALPPSSPKAYYPALTGLRAVAAYLVFWLHFRPLAWHEGWADRIIGQFYVGVSMFFVLSGFVIATRYQGSVQLTRGWWRAYFWRRAARIYPVYFVLNSSALFHVYWPWPAGKTANTLLLIVISESMLRGFSNTLKYVGLPQGWSLTPEECFYFSVPVLLVLWRQRGQLGAVGFALASFALGVVLTLLCQGRPALHGLFGTWHHLFNFTFFGRVLEFTLGVGLARWWGGRPSGQMAGVPWRTLAGVGWLALTISGLAWVNSPQAPYDGNLYPSAILLHILVFPLGMTLLLAGLLAEGSWVRRFLSTPLLLALGRQSYVFYLLHVGLLSIWWHNTFGWGRHIFWQFVITIALAEVIHRLLEVPVHRWILARTVGVEK